MDADPRMTSRRAPEKRRAVIPNVLTIAGTDPSGGAGIQADIKTFSALGAYAASVITALVAQNTRGVRSFQVIEPDFVAAQIDAVFDDLRIDAVKIGMVATAEVAITIAERLRHYHAKNIVLDPVMVAKSGDRLLAENAVTALRERLVPIADIITPNIPEGAVLLGEEASRTLTEMRGAVRRLDKLGARWVLLKGGHLDGPESPDLLSDGEAITELPAHRIATKNTHGGGCTLSSAIAALLPRYAMAEAVARAKAYVTGALAASDQLSVGGGHGPLHHFHALWAREKDA